MVRTDEAVPLYFAARSIRGRNMELKVGDLFPFQDKGFIQGLTVSLKLDPRLPFAKLPYVKALNMRSSLLADRVREQGLNFEQAKALVQEAA